MDSAALRCGQLSGRTVTGCTSSEADATIPAEYVLLNHFLGEPEPQLEAKMAKYLRRIQSDRHHGWPLFHDGDFDLSASVKAYYALKIRR